jgi:hypothetical protein
MTLKSLSTHLIELFFWIFMKDAEPGKPPKAKCRICGEEVDQIQLARHVTKKHGDKQRDKEDN